MSVYNGERFLTAAIESVLGQTFSDFEFLILDDGSRDGTRAIVEAMAARDSRIRPIVRENRGLIASLNQLIAEARAPLIARMDADDIALPERFSTQIEWMLLKNVDVCGTCVKTFGYENRVSRGLYAKQSPDQTISALLQTL